jgi:hypothetical protein
MKYVISERQYRVIQENLDQPDLWVRRRLNYEIMNEYIDKALGEEPNPCEEYESDVDFAYGIIDYAVSYFLSTNENFHNSNDYDHYYRFLFNKCKEWFFDYLLKDYRFTCYDKSEIYF